MSKIKENLHKSKNEGGLDKTMPYIRPSVQQQENHELSSQNKVLKNKNNKSFSHSNNSNQGEIAKDNLMDKNKKEYLNTKEFIIEKFESITNKIKKEKSSSSHKKLEKLEKENEELKRETYYLENSLLELQKKYNLLENEYKLNNSKKK